MLYNNNKIFKGDKKNDLEFIGGRRSTTQRQ